MKNITSILITIAFAFGLLGTNEAHAQMRWRSECPNNYNNTGCVSWTCHMITFAESVEVEDGGNQATTTGLFGSDTPVPFATCVTNNNILNMTCCDPTEVTVVCAIRTYYSASPCIAASRYNVLNPTNITRSACNGRQW